mmetsp:Transcript_73177/g.214679  ORF Transcript_73177/g.214679 Transcript_73177/m.214679 type:complete len:315 (+) Transcript_73177:494-1438(+)
MPPCVATRSCPPTAGPRPRPPDGQARPGPERRHQRSPRRHRGATGPPTRSCGAGIGCPADLAGHPSDRTQRDSRLWGPRGAPLESLAARMRMWRRGRPCILLRASSKRCASAPARRVLSRRRCCLGCPTCLSAVVPQPCRSEWAAVHAARLLSRPAAGHCSAAAGLPGSPRPPPRQPWSSEAGLPHRPSRLRRRLLPRSPAGSLPAGPRLHPSSSHAGCGRQPQLSPVPRQPHCHRRRLRAASDGHRAGTDCRPRPRQGGPPAGTDSSAGTSRASRVPGSWVGHLPLTSAVMCRLPRPPRCLGQRPAGSAPCGP